MRILAIRAIASALKYADTIALNAGVRKVCSRSAYPFLRFKGAEKINLKGVLALSLPSLKPGKWEEGYMRACQTSTSLRVSNIPINLPIA